MSARRVAFEALEIWESTSRYAEDILAELAAKSDLSSSDRGLAVEILYGTIRNLFLVDEVIDRLRRGRLQSGTQNLLRIGLYQLLCSEIAEHAAVNETVSLARKRERGLINAILRNAQRGKDDLLEEIRSWPLEDRYSHPGFLIERWERQHGSDTVEALCRWNNEPPDSYARVNRLHPDTEALNRVESETQPCWVGPDFPDFFSFEGAPRHDWLDEGLVYVQDPSTSIACRLLDPQPGETVLDACAAPGGKTSLLFAGMRQEGRLVAVDNAEPRLGRMKENLERLRAGDVETRLFDWLRDDPSSGDFPEFDAILLDVPCSNTGVMRRRVDVRWRLQPGDFARQAEVQSRLLARVAPLLKPGGRIVYSTCSIDREENEDVIESVASDTGLACERTERSLPWRDGFDGAFAALLKR